MATKPKTKALSKTVLNQREKFCQLYVLTGNGTQSVLDAFPRLTKSTSAATQAWRMLRDVEILQRIRELRIIGHEQLTHTFEETVQEIDRLAHFDPADMFDENGRLLPLHEMPEVARKMVNEIEFEAIRDEDRAEWLTTVKVKYGKDKQGYLDKMMKFYNAYEHHQKAGASKEIKVYLMYETDALA